MHTIAANQLSKADTIIRIVLDMYSKDIYIRLQHAQIN